MSTYHAVVVVVEGDDPQGIYSAVTRALESSPHVEDVKFVGGPWQVAPTGVDSVDEYPEFSTRDALLQHPVVIHRKREAV